MLIATNKDDENFVIGLQYLSLLEPSSENT
jgi:hypothetical protein